MTSRLAIVPHRPGTQLREEAFRVEKREAGVTALQCFFPDSLVYAVVMSDKRWNLNTRNLVTSHQQLNFHMNGLNVKYGSFGAKPSDHLMLETLFDDKMEIVGQDFYLTTTAVAALDYNDILELQKPDELNPLVREEHTEPVASEFYALEAFVEQAQRKAVTMRIGDASPKGFNKSLRIEANRGLRYYFEKNKLTGFAKVTNGHCDKREWALQVVGPEDSTGSTCGMLHSHSLDEHLNMGEAIFHALGMRTADKRRADKFVKKPKSFVENINSFDEYVRSLPPREDASVLICTP